MSDPSTETWRTALGQSTSAQLRQTQAALAASQADLTEREKERNLACELAADLFNDVERLEAERDALAVLNAELKAEAAHWRGIAERSLAAQEQQARELATARYQNRILTAENQAAIRALNEKERHD